MPDIKRDAAAIAKNMDFAVHFASALKEIKDAVSQNRGVNLDAKQTKAIMYGFKLLKRPSDG